ncbi:MAG: low molecular weight phosphotyrosine protein phosphatase [Bacteroidales bacterium]|nr:low molecular weight phosphotyrosine protein phosphatase [Bacteroidales bacterium]
MKKILFVCMGNICRSAAAEAVLKKYIADKGLENEYMVDSAGIIGCHVGEPADSRMISAAAERGYNVDSIARRVSSQDFDRFDCVIAMDNKNVSDLRTLCRTYEHNKKLCKLTDFSSAKFIEKYKMTEVPDPYYGGPDGFTLVLDLLEDAMPQILSRV